MELKWSKDKSESRAFTCFVCVLIMWSAREGANFILGEVLIGYYQVEDEADALLL